MRHRMLIAAIALAVGGHSTEPGGAPASAPASVDVGTLDPVFDCFHLNTAWGFALAGTMIDRNGDIYRYRMDGKGWAPASTRANGPACYRDADLRVKFAQAQLSGSVDAKVLNENSAAIVKAAEGALERADGGARDAGTSTCHAYVHDQAQGCYRDVELGSDGGASDTRVTNTSAEAKSLLTWLKTVGVAR